MQIPVTQINAAGGAMTQLYDSGALGIAAANIDTGAAGIAGGYKALMIWVLARTTDAGAIAQVDITVNNDTSSIYDRAFEGANNATQQASSSVAAAAWDPQIHGDGGSTGYPGVLFITIPGYADTNFWKVGTLASVSPDQTAGSNQIGSWSIGYRATTAISQLKVAAQGAENLKAGSRLTIYGLL